MSLVNEWDRLVIDGRVFECSRISCKTCPDMAVCDAMARRAWVIEVNKEKKIVMVTAGIGDTLSITINEFAFLNISHGTYGSDWFFLDYDSIILHCNGKWIKKPRYDY